MSATIRTLKNMSEESKIISRLRNLAKVGADVLVGIGDDAAVIKGQGGKDLIVCCDLMVEGVHFRTEWSPPGLLGRKALASSMSDIAAMGGIARFAMISIALPPACSPQFIDQLFNGVFELANATGVSIIGGDTSSSRDSLFIDVSVVGECESGTAVTRRGANVGDTIYVSGSLGGSALGLSLLENGIRIGDSNSSDPKNNAVLKHLAPEPQMKLGRALGEAKLATAMIDISDGLSTDLWHILEESDCGAVIDGDSIPIAECVRYVATESSVIDPLLLALNGGEEYELLFTSPSENYPQVRALGESLATTITAIGTVVGEKSLQLKHNGALEALKPLGYQHLI